MHNGITVRDVMNREFVGVSESDTLEDAAELMQTEPAEAVVVLRGTKPIGSLSTATALGALLDGEPRDQSVGEVMEPPVPTIEPEAVLSEAIQQFVGRGATHLLVVDDQIVGLLTERDVLAASETVDATAAAGRPTEAERTEPIESTDSAEPGGDPEQSIQGICEGCGSLTPELSTVNGQLVCPACRAY
jgi:signal-transduction protein with cAMP-binding, CBS, and nucleotidyltransferase domain